jgi:hypothetical protein
MKNLLLLFLVFSFLNGKGQGHKTDELVKKCYKAMGGIKNYNNTRFLQWNFFDLRKHSWDKHENKLRIDYQKEKTIILINLNDKTGRVIKKGREIKDADSSKIFLKEAYETWINDSYWLVMPFKLLDPGVNLSYVGTEKTEDGKMADKVELTFKEVGVTPNNKYHVFFDQESHLISQWSYFPKSTDEKPRFTMPWTEYKTYGKILLSGSRGTRSLLPINAPQSLPESLFTEF